MTTQENDAVHEVPPTAGPAWGDPVPEHQRDRKPWSAKKIAISAAVAVVIVAGGTVGVIAATNGSSSTTTQGGFGGRGGAGGPGGGFGGGAGGLANALHGDFTASNGNGGYLTERLQTGTVTAVSATSIGLRSADGYTGTYTVGSSTVVDQGQDTIDKVANGNTVTVVAALSGGNGTATTVTDLTLEQANGGGFGGGGFGGGRGGGGGGGGFGGRGGAGN